MDFLKPGEKKVEYIELIYDLIFVYIIGRNNSLLEHVTNGFFDVSIYLTYVLCTLITIQIWYMTTLFINRYGDGSLLEYIGLFINMYLLYYMADGTRIQWQDYFYRYSIAWMLILLNIAAQYRIKKKQIQETEPWSIDSARQSILTLLIQVAMIAVSIPVYALTGVPLSPLAMIFGIAFAFFGRKRAGLVAVDFSHLTERVMLYIVFTFGEMIIAISAYFGGEITPDSVYFSLTAFLVVVGLFVSYGFMYDRLLDREMNVSGNSYMLIHIFIIFALSNLTCAMELMHEDRVAVLPKCIYLVASFAVYYVFLFMLAPFTRFYEFRIRKHWVFILVPAAFLVLILVFYQYAHVSIGFCVLLTFSVWILEYRYWKNNIAQI